MLKSATHKKSTSLIQIKHLRTKRTTKNKHNNNNNHNYSIIKHTPSNPDLNEEIDLVKSLDIDIPIFSILQRAHSNQQLKQSVDFTYNKQSKRRSSQLLQLPSLNLSTVKSSINILDKKTIRPNFNAETEREYKDIKQRLSSLLEAKKRNNDIIAKGLKDIDDDKMKVEILEKGAQNICKDTIMPIQQKGLGNIFKSGMMNIMRNLHPHQQEQKAKGANKETVLKEIEEKKDMITALRAKNKDIIKELAIAKAKYKDCKVMVLNYYTKLLYEGLQCGKEGLSWIIKAIWDMGENIPDDLLPKFLDSQAIDYLFTVTKMNIEIDGIKNEIVKAKEVLRGAFTCKDKKPMDLFKTKLEFQKNLYKERKYDSIEHGTNVKEDLPSKSLKLVNEWLAKREKIDEDSQMKLAVIDKLYSKQKEIEGEMRRLKNAEMERLFKEYIINNYENRYKVPIDVVIGALVGETNKDREMLKFSKTKKVYLDTIRRAQFYSYFVNYDVQAKKE